VLVILLLDVACAFSLPGDSGRTFDARASPFREQRRRVDLRRARQGLPLGEEQIMAIETRTRISNEAYERLALSQPERKWELWDGHLREKPGMTYAHNSLAARLSQILGAQLDWSEFEVRTDAGHVHRPNSTYVVPDLFVLPIAHVTPHLRQPDVLEVYDQPLPLVVEVWSRSTGDYDVAEKLGVYQRRGDREIWYFHPYEHTLTAWRRQPDGNYEKSIFTSGIVRPVALPGVEIDLEALFSGIAP
jgi:Uma2 family endonuclease